MLQGLCWGHLWGHGDANGVVGDPEPRAPQGVAALALHHSPGDVLVPACSWATHHGHQVSAWQLRGSRVTHTDGRVQGGTGEQQHPASPAGRERH